MGHSKFSGSKIYIVSCRIGIEDADLKPLCCYGSIAINCRGWKFLKPLTADIKIHYVIVAYAAVLLF